MTRSRSFIATPPGASIKEQLIERGMSQKEFATRMDLSEKHISKLINGDVQLTTDVAIRLEIVLGIPAQFWNNLEAIYREKLTRVEAENTMDVDEVVARQFPYNEMAKLGWVPTTRNSKEKVINLRKYFEVVELSLLDNNQITRIACRRLATTKKSDLSVIAWSQQAKIEARNVQTSSINIKGLIQVIPKIREMTLLQPMEFCSPLQSLLSEYGIALIFLPHLKGSFLQGASFIDGKKIVIGLTTRGKDADIFWFSLFHELAHIILGHIGQIMGTTEEDEKKADQWAKDTLISPIEFEKFKTHNDFTESSIHAFAAQQGIAPGIVVGRLQNEGCIPFSTLNQLNTQYDI